MKIKPLLLFFFYSIAVSSYAQSQIATLKVMSGEFDRENTLVSVSLDGIDLDLANNRIALFEISDEQELLTASQLDMDDGPKLYWVLKQKLLKGETREYVIRSLPHLLTKENPPKINVLRENENLIIQSEGKNVLKYNFQKATLPEGVPTSYERAGFIHPLWSPSGEVLTRIQPPDHYHHVGIWNPWTHTSYQGEVIDYWNLNKSEGTVVPVTIHSTTTNNLFGGFKAIHNHVNIKANNTVTLKEEWNVRVWDIDDNGWVVDFTSTLNCATDSAFKILQYRYQGFGFRATEKWDDKTANILTSEGKNKEDGNSTRARWCDINGKSNVGTSGIVFITNPSNYNYPEPIRIWPTGSNEGKENVFFNFNPSMDRDWNLLPGNVYQLKYRMYVYDGKIDLSKAEQLWREFAYPPSVEIKIINQSSHE